MFSVASWNIRGLNRAPKQKEVRHVVNENNLSVCAILESHVDVAVIYNTCKKVCERWKWTSNGNLCPKGTRIILGWNDDLVDVMIMAQTDQVMHLQVNIRADNKAFFCSIIYVDNYYVSRRALWHNLVGHASLMCDPWVLLGDFNATRNLEDHSCGEFKECVQRMQVMDVNATGRHFTWNQKPKGSNGILKKIDRIMCNYHFLVDFPGSFAIFQPYRISDHSPCVIRIPKGLKTPLRKLLHDQENLHDRVNRLCVELDEAQKAIDRNPSSKDANTAYFHRIVKSKCARNRIDMVRDSSNVLHEGNAVPGAFFSHYEQFLGLEGASTPLNDQGLFTRVLANHKRSFMGQMVLLRLPSKSHGIWWVVEITNASGISSPRVDYDLCLYYSYSVVLMETCNAGLIGKHGLRPRDDLFLFARGHPNSVRVIIDALEEFKNVLGLVPSIPKSNAFFCNVPNALKASILSSMPFAEGMLPVKYLGVPIISSRILYRDCKVLVEKLESRCQGEMKKGKDKVAWEAVCLPHREGGLGIRRLDDFNVALVAYHVWCILINKESLWVQWIYSYKLKGRSFWDVLCSWVIWVDSCPLCDMLTVRNIVRSRFSLSNTVSDLVFNGFWRWPHDWLSRFSNIVNIPVLNIKDELNDVIVWRNVQGVFQRFSVAGAWDSLRLRADVVDWYHVFWFPHCIPRHALNLWLVIKEKLKTQDRLRQ
ncbi:putative reverse transcriptase domain-containing protein [Tanacetum coccineum]